MLHPFETSRIDHQIRTTIFTPITKLAKKRRTTETKITNQPNREKIFYNKLQYWERQEQKNKSLEG